MRRIRMKKSRKYEQDKLQAAINASARRALDDLEKRQIPLPNGKNWDIKWFTVPRHYLDVR